MAEHRLTAEPTHSRWNRALEPRLTISSGDTVHMSCLDASGGQVKPGASVEDFLAIDRSRIHALTGPIRIDGAEPGDVLEIQVLQVEHRGWGWSSVIPGLGFLKEQFREPYLFHWALDPEVSRSLGPAVVPLRPFCGVMGVAPAEDGEFRTRPPGPFGGNMDVRELCAGATLYLPVLNPGALFSAGDAHAAQGDGEVCINGIECPAEVISALPGAPPATALRAAARISRITLPGRTRGCMDRGRVRPRRNAGRPRRHRAHGGAAGRPVVVCTRPRLPAVQRGDEAAHQPGGQRTHDHRERSHAQMRAAQQKDVLTDHADQRPRHRSPSCANSIRATSRPWSRTT